MAVSCDTNDLATNSACFQCLDEQQQMQVQTYLLAVIAGGSTDPNALLAAAKDFAALSEQQLLMVQVYLLCSITGG